MALTPRLRSFGVNMPKPQDFPDLPTNLDVRDWLPLVIDSLPQRERDVINAVYYERVSLRVIARRNGEDKKSVQRTLERAIGRIRERFAALDRSFEQWPD